MRDSLCGLVHFLKERRVLIFNSPDKRVGQCPACPRNIFGHDMNRGAKHMQHRNGFLAHNIEIPPYDLSCRLCPSDGGHRGGR